MAPEANDLGGWVSGLFARPDRNQAGQADFSGITAKTVIGFVRSQYRMGGLRAGLILHRFVTDCTGVPI
ncbi:MAG: hypothetical protein C0605_17320 [Hyphomicrobiales bacterium]|nr:MAG: hypothetical protein C0605_17320 [Hyphomicrobiales bacterium]